MQTEIVLEGLDFFGYHGLYPQEQKEGNRFRVDVKMELDCPFRPEGLVLDETIDYAIVYELIKTEMEQACPLLESLSQRICQAIYKRFPQLNHLEVSLAKANPGIGGLCQWVRVKSIWKKD
jgi:dihydroneopterin aldolase